MFSKNRKQFKKRFSRGKVSKGIGKRRKDDTFQMDDLSDVGEDKSNSDSEEVKKVMKERDRNYKKFLIEQGKSSAIKWETFSDSDKEATESLPEEIVSDNQSKMPRKKRKIEEESQDDHLSAKRTKKMKEFKDSGSKMDQIKAKLKEKYDNDKWNDIPVQEAPSQQRCLACRQVGHLLKNCKAFAGKSKEICLKCGSSDHKHFACTVFKGPKFNFATCFKCKEMGHISKQCPKNSSGIYPDGGCCSKCQSVDHLARDCPKKPKRGGRKRHSKDSKKFFRVNKSRN
ncbi:uncharacterized protein LOC132262285 [Phlebotomus argentipes]|uniref:uncharacterized protein LOC132262285 n=1 Tax=Phlebotomus argentipes TaxID=94469 RepID=UPI00289349EA|nr:uncharacterized protein LOC132262285 [Phlebotomus argentipes]